MQMNNFQICREKQNLLNTIKTETKKDYASNHFDERMEELLAIARELILSKGVFHLTIHFSSSQLICWTFDNPYSYQVYHADEVFAEHFMRLFAPLNSQLHTCIARNQVDSILQSIWGLREKQEGSELRNASIHMINGYIALSFACDDTRYINFKDFIEPAKIAVL